MTRPHELPPEAARAVVALTQHLRGQAAEAAAEIAERVADEVPEYGRYAQGDEATEFEVSVRALVDLFLDLVPAGGRLSEPQRAEVADIGEERAREDHSSAALIAALDVAFDVARSRVFDAFWRLRPRRAEQVALQSVVATLDRFRFDVVDAYREGYGRVDVEERRDRDRARDAFVTSLLVGPAPDLRQVHIRAADLGLTLVPPLELVVVVDAAAGSEPEPAPDAFAANIPAQASRLARALPSPVLGPVPVEHDTRVPPLLCVLLPDATPTRWRRAHDALAACCPDLGLAALHARADDLSRLHATLIRLLAAAPVLDRLADRFGPVVDPEALYGHRLVDATTLAEQEHELRVAVGPLKAVPQTAEEHIATLRGLGEEQFNMAAVGRRLGMSAEAVANRVDRIEELTGLSVKDRGHWRRFDLALCLLDLYDGVLPDPGDRWWTEPSAALPLGALLAQGGAVAPPIGGDRSG